MKEDFIANEYIYSEGAPSGPLYILQSGVVEIFANNEKGEEKRIEVIQKPGEIFGIPETVLKINRINSAKAKTDVKVKIIDLTGKDLKQTIKLNPLLGLNISINLSKAFQRRNNYLNELSKFFKEAKNAVNSLCLKYYESVENINKLNAKFRFPWLNSIYEKGKTNIIYNYGDSVNKGKDIIEQEVIKKELKYMEEEELSTAGAKTFKKGDIVCREGDIGNEMYILMEGSLNVYVGEQKIAEIKNKGSIIGEIAVLLGYSSKKYEKRTATVKAKEDSKVIVIPGPNLEPVIKKDSSLIVHITKTLSERLPETDNAIISTDSQFQKYLALVNKMGTTTANCPKAFEILINEINLSAKSNMEIVDRILKDVEQYLDESKQTYDIYFNEYQKLQN